MATLIQLQCLDNEVSGGKVAPTPYRQRKRRDLESQIPENLARNYNRVRGRHSDAVVPVVDGVCQGCFVQLPPAVMGQLQNPRNMTCCDHCGRLLYLSL